MNFDNEHYVPCLRWKQGEYQAVLRLSKVAKVALTPLIEVPEKGYDFETRSDKKTVDEHLEPFASRVQKKWGKKPCFVDLNLLEPGARMADGQHPVTFVFDELKAEKCLAVPVTGLERTRQYQSAIKRLLKSDGAGICLRLSIEQACASGLKSNVIAFLKSVETAPDDCDLILDLGSPNFIPLAGFGKLIQTAIAKLPHLKKWRTLTLLGSSFPQSMAEVKSSPAVISRSEWLIYEFVVTGLATSGIRTPTFGDYAISHPDVLQMDMRKVKPSATIRYTIDDAWFIVKGPNVRQNGFDQYRGHCKTVMSSGRYCGPGYSAGDAYIDGCASGTEGTGNLTTWRWVGTNHHLEKVVTDVANFYGSSGKP